MPVIGTPVTACPTPEVPAEVAAAATSPVVKEPIVGEGACYYDCDQVFGMIRVLPTIKHGTRVEWEIHPHFRDPTPHEFQLQFGRTGTNEADDWEPVGETAFSVFYMEDDTPRVFGKTQWTHYRICLTTPVATYFSRPVPADATLEFKYRRRWAEMIRAHTILLKQEEGVSGFLLKQKLFGAPCDCLDWQTFEIRNPQHELCYGTGFLGGYYDPVACVYAALDRKVSHNELDAGKARGTIDDMLKVKAKMLPIPQLFERDVWVDQKRDARWFVHQIEARGEYQGVPVLLSVELRLAPYSHPIYQIEIPDQVPA